MDRDDWSLLTKRTQSTFYSSHNVSGIDGGAETLNTSICVRQPAWPGEYNKYDSGEIMQKYRGFPK